VRWEFNEARMRKHLGRGAKRWRASESFPKKRKKTDSEEKTEVSDIGRGHLN